MKSSQKPTKKDRDSLKELKKKIRAYDKLYYKESSSKISDKEYDELFQDLKRLETKFPSLITKDSPTQKITKILSRKFEKVKHKTPMLSLENTFSLEALDEFDKKVKRILGLNEKESEKDIEYISEPKFDGISLELVYEKGILKKALTRGDGLTGENVLKNALGIHGISPKLKSPTPPPLFEIRGEVLILKKDFEKINQRLEEKGEKTFSNPRNTASGLLRKLELQQEEKENLRFFPYGIGSPLKNSPKTQEDLLELIYKELDYEKEIKKSIFKSLKAKTGNIKKVTAHYNSVLKKRKEILFEMDGMVIKVNKLSLQNELGFVSKYPKWATALKFPAEVAVTKIKDIVIQVGRTGALTPVAIMEPVRTGGAQITNATVHNQEEINRKSIYKGAQVEIQRAGGVIPEIIKVINPKKEAFQIPSKCPECHKEAYVRFTCSLHSCSYEIWEPIKNLKQSNKKFCPECKNRKTKNGTSLKKELVKQAKYFCKNRSCSALLPLSLKHFVSKKAMNIDKLGDKIIDQVLEGGLVSSFSDIYTLTKDQISNLERKADKSASNILKSIEDSKRVSLNHFIFSLGIDLIGEEKSRDLALYFQTLDNLLSASKEELSSCIGDKASVSLSQALKDLKPEIKKLKKILYIQEKKVSKNKSLQGLNIVITGTFSIPRDEIKNLIKELGGKTPSQVNQKTSFLLKGESAGSKLQKALDLKIEIKDWEKFQNFTKSKT